MRVVLDTNVLLSAAVFGGPPGRIVELAGEGRLQLILSTPIIDEFRRVLREKLQYSDSALFAVETLIRKVSLPLVEPEFPLHIIAADPDDNRVLEAAIAGNANCIVSGDRHLLRLKSFRDIPILTPRQFLNQFEQDEDD